ncbi:hypothetical protein ABZX85_47145 [Streptomyces sp. NPDC004539]|uniref:hypothetical protein n=1 Tax=Streptomyces sp. NPDC004539 TaxID=3154280 RepID=UPI0033B12BE5
MSEISDAGAVRVEYSYFPVGELWEPGFERHDSGFDLAADDAVLTVPGQIVVRTRVQDHTAPVVLTLSQRQVESPGEGWVLVGSVPYRPVYTGRMSAFDTTNGPAGPSREPVEVFGRLTEPGEPALVLDPSRIYAVQVWAFGREDSRERYEAAVPDDQGGLADQYETYVIAFSPSGVQELPRSAQTQDRRGRLAAKYGKPPLNMR